MNQESREKQLWLEKCLRSSANHVIADPSSLFPTVTFAGNPEYNSFKFLVQDCDTGDVLEYGQDDFYSQLLQILGESHQITDFIIRMRSPKGVNITETLSLDSLFPIQNLILECDGSNFSSFHIGQCRVTSPASIQQREKNWASLLGGIHGTL